MLQSDQRVSFYSTARRLIYEITDAAHRFDWEKATKYTNDLETEVITLLICRGVNSKEIDKMDKSFYNLLRIYPLPYHRLGNDGKKGECERQLTDIIQFIGQYGIYVGQDNVAHASSIEGLKSMMFDITTLMPIAMKNVDARDEIANKLEFVKDKILPKIVMSKLLLIKTTVLINTVQSIIFIKGETPSKIQEQFIESIKELKVMTDFIMLIAENPEMEPLVDKYLEEEKELTAKIINKIAEKIAWEIFRRKKKDGK